HLTPKAVDLLRFLINERPRIVKKQEIYERIWPDTHVEEVNLSVHISELRSALGEDSKESRFIRTSHRYGYVFVGDVRLVKSFSRIRIRIRQLDVDLLDCENIVGCDHVPLLR